MSILKDWTCKGLDLTYDGINHNNSKFKESVLYPKGYWFNIVGVNHANSAKGIMERINTVDNAIIAASKV